MINNLKFFSFVFLTLFLNACAHLPDATVGYYLAKSEVKFKIVRTVACDTNNTILVVSSSTPSVTHSADHNQFEIVNLADLKGPFSDTDVKFDFYDDGRLKGINSTVTGQGETILKTTVSVIGAALALKSRGVTIPEECEFIKSAGGGKPITLTYEGVVDINKSGDVKQIVPPDTASSYYAYKLRDAIGDVYAVVEEIVPPQNTPLNYTAQSGDVLLKVQQPGLVKIKVVSDSGNEQVGIIWEGALPAAQFGKSYSIPLPAPTTFGKQTLSISFQESGALNSLQYASSNNSVNQVLNVVNSSLSALEEESTAEKAANVKAEADLIAQQQRLAQCIADPANCE